MRLLPKVSSRHAFPPQPRRTGSATSLPQSSPNPYSPTTPGAMTAAARSPHPSTSRETIESTSFQPRLATRTSFHSQRSSVAPENVYGTAPAGVIGKNKPREVIRIERDYSEGELCQFWSGWIWELEGRVSLTILWCPRVVADALLHHRSRRPTFRTRSTSSTLHSLRPTTLTSPASTTAAPF